MNTDDIAADLRRRIVAGREPSDARPPDALIPGSETPTVKALMGTTGAARETCHKALRQLSDAGLIHSRRGRTSIVADHRPLWIISGHTYDRSYREDPSGLTVFEQQTRDAGQGARTDHHFDADQPCPAWAADLLGLDPGQPALLLTGEGFAIPAGADGKPAPSREYVAGIYDCFVPDDVAQLVPQLLEVRDETVKDRWVGGVWSVIERGLGQPLVTMMRQRIYGAMTEEAEGARFGIDRSGVPVMVEENVMADASGRPLVATRMLKLFGTAVWDLGPRPLGD